MHSAAGAWAAPRLPKDRQRLLETRYELRELYDPVRLRKVVCHRCETVAREAAVAAARIRICAEDGVIVPSSVVSARACASVAAKVAHTFCFASLLP